MKYKMEYKHEKMFFASIPNIFPLRYPSGRVSLTWFSPQKICGCNNCFPTKDTFTNFLKEKNYIANEEQLKSLYEKNNDVILI